MRLVAVSGVDGSGKSTLMTTIEQQLRARGPSINVTRLWLRWNPRALQPSEARPVSTVDARHEGHSSKRLARQLGLSRLWVDAAVRSYQKQLALQLGAAQGADVVLADRYVLDFIADLVAGGVLDAAKTLAVIGRLPAADLALVADVPDGVLIERLNPGDDPELVTSRARSYRELAALTTAQLVDGRDTATIENIVGTVVELVGRQ
mgnify:CR=1 FL=1